MTNYVMSLASSPSIHHPVELAGGEFCHYHYSNLPKILRDWQVSESDFRRLIGPFLPPARVEAGGLRYYAFTHDGTKMLKAHSPCLADRQYVPSSNNVIAGNRAIGVGYPVSALHLGIGRQGWCPPLALERLGSQADANAVAVRQLISWLQDPQLPFRQELCVVRSDSSYGKAAFLGPLYAVSNLVVIARLRPGLRVWRPAGEAMSKDEPKRVYGDKLYLLPESRWKTYHRQGKAYQVHQEALCDQPADEVLHLPCTLSNGRAALIDIQRWNNLLIRTKHGVSMKDKPFDVVRVQILDARDHHLVFQRPLFLAVSGQCKNQLDSRFVRAQYRERYDVEPYYRFAKNKLLLDKLQTPIAAHLDPWLRIVQATSWLLFTARQEIDQIHCPPWQKYLPKNKSAVEQQNPLLTIAQTQRAIHLLFRTFDLGPFLPEKCKKGAGRQPGLTLPQRTRYAVVKKTKKSIQKLKCQYNE